MDKKTNIWGKWLYWFIFAVSVIIVYKTLDNFSDITNWIKGVFEIMMPFIIGILLSYLFYIPCKKVEKIYQKAKPKIFQKKARILSIFTIYILAAVIIILAFQFIIPALTRSITDLASNIGTYYQNTINSLNNIPEDSVLRQIDIQAISEALNKINIAEYINLSTVFEYAKGVIGVATSIFDFFVSIIVSIYILIERTQIICFFRKLIRAIFKEKTCKTIGKYFNNTNQIFFKFLSSQILDAIIVGILTAIAMSLLGVKYAVLLGFFIGLSNLIPYFGAIVGVGISIIITIFTGGFGQAIWMAIIVIILQQIDANIINPKIVGNSLEISPLLVIFAVAIGGAYFGILGMFLAVPVFTILKLIIQDYIDYKSNIKETT